MALTERYFSTSGAGAADGTTWADRAALFSAGNWNSTGTIFTGFGFNTNAMRARIGPGTYTCSQSLASGLFANAPTANNPLIMAACDSSGNLIAPPDPNWTSDLPAFDDSTLPVISGSTNIAIVNLVTADLRLLKITSSGRTGGAVVTAAAGMDWCVVSNSAANTSAQAVSAPLQVANCVFSCSGTSYSAIFVPASAAYYDNIRCVGVAGSSGNRDGVANAVASVTMSRLTSISNGGRGYVYTGSGAAIAHFLYKCTIANNGGSGIVFPNTASQTARQFIDHCMITGNTGYGVDPGGANTNLVVRNSRLRDNSTANFNTFGNYPSDMDNYTTDSDDATEYVDSAGTANYQIKNSATIWGSGYGVSEQSPSSSGGVIVPTWAFGMEGVLAG